MDNMLSLSQRYERGAQSQEMPQAVSSSLPTLTGFLFFAYSSRSLPPFTF